MFATTLQRFLEIKVCFWHVLPPSTILHFRFERKLKIWVAVGVTTLMAGFPEVSMNWKACFDFFCSKS